MNAQSEQFHNISKLYSMLIKVRNKENSIKECCQYVLKIS